MKTFTTLITLLTFSTITACGDEWDPEYWCKGYAPEVGSTAAYVVNGEPVSKENGNVLATVALFNRRGNRNCSGVAMQPQIVLTAAHCVRDSISVSRTLDGPRIKVDDVYVHAFYDNNPPDFDIAVLHLEEPIEGPFPAGIYDMAAGGVEPDYRYFCTHMVAQGFGLTKDTNPDGLYEIPYQVGYAVDNWTVVTGPVEPDTGICKGDSGSPLYAFVEDHPWQHGQGPHFLVMGIALTSENTDTCTANTKHTHLENYSYWYFEAVHCAKGGEDRLWDFYMLGKGQGFRGNTCEQLRKPWGE